LPINKKRRKFTKKTSTTKLKEVSYAINTITLEFKAVRVKIPVEGLTFEGLEEMVFDIRQEIGKMAFVNALSEYDAFLAKSRDRRGDD